MPAILPTDCWENILQLYDEKITSVQFFLFTTLETRRKLDRVYKFCKDSWAQLFEGRLALNPGLNLTRVSFSCVQKHFQAFPWIILCYF